MTGFWNRILFADLSSSEIWEEQLELGIWDKYIGGIGLGSYLFSKHGGNHDPFSERNPIIITTGPLVGTAFPNTGRHEIVSRSPQTNLLGESNSGGHFGFNLKKSGLDGIVIKGIADFPVSLFITEEKRWIEKADNLWGLDIYKVQEKIKKTGKFSIATIGPAGENKVLFSAVMNDEGRAAGRTGLGAVFGSKKLKAIAVSGKLQVPVYNKPEFNKHAGEVAKNIYNSAFSSGLRSYGSMIWIDGGQGLGDVPAHYFTDHNFNYDELSGMKFNETFKVKSYHCSSCVIGCGRTVEMDNHTVDGPEYETVAVLGPLLMNTDMHKILEWNHKINALGMDTISVGVIISALRYFLDNNLIHNDVAELSAYFEDNLAHVTKLIEDIAFTKNIGADIAKGLEKFALTHEIEKDYIATVKGLEMPMHDVRAFKLQGLTYATSSRGADHLQSEMYAVDIGATQDEIGIKMGDRWAVDSDERVISLIKTQDYRQIQNSAIICVYAQPPAQDLFKGLNLATGLDLSAEDLMQRGSLIINLKRAINETLGLKKEQDWLSKIARKKIEGEPDETELTDIELKSLINRYYRLRNWKN